LPLRHVPCFFLVGLLHWKAFFGDHENNVLTLGLLLFNFHLTFACRVDQKEEP
jgi:hypothetical protein